MNPVKMSCHVKIVWSCTGKHQSGKNYAPVSPEYVPMYADQAAVKTAYLCLFFFLILKLVMEQMHQLQNANHKSIFIFVVR